MTHKTVHAFVIGLFTLATALCLTGMWQSLSGIPANFLAAQFNMGGVLSGINVQGIEVGDTTVGYNGSTGQLSIGLDGASTGSAPGCGSTNCIGVPSTGSYAGIAEDTSLRSAIQNWTNFALGFLSLIAMIALIYAGFQYVTARGEADQADNAKRGIIYVTVGIIVIMLAYALVNTLIVGGPAGGDLNA